MPPLARNAARLTRHTSAIGMRARSKISRSATRANTIAPKISPSTFARSAATLRTCRSGSNAALIIRQYGGTLIRVAIIPRSMGTSSGIEQGQRKLLFDPLFATILFKMYDKNRKNCIFLQNNLCNSKISSTFALFCYVFYVINITLDAEQ